MQTRDQGVLAVIADVDTSGHVLAAAADRAELKDVPLVVLHVLPQRVYEDRQRSRSTIRELRNDGFTFTLEQATESARNVAERAARTFLADRDIPYTAVGEVGQHVPAVLAVAAGYGCGTVFVPATGSWVRRIVDPNRKLAKRFEGTVVRVPAPRSENLRTVNPPPVDKQRE